MNQMTPTTPGAAVQRQGGLTPMESSLAKAEVSLALLERPYHSKAWDGLLEVYRYAYRRHRWSAPEYNRRDWHRVATILAQDSAPTLAAIDVHRERVDAVASAPPHRKATIALLTLMLDSFKRSDVSDDFRGAALYDIMARGYPPAVVALACQTIRRTATFLPSIAELLAACEEAKATWREMQAHLSMLREVLEQATALIALPEPLEP